MAGRRRNNGGGVFTDSEHLRADYEAAKPSRFRRVRNGIKSSGSGADYHIRNQQHFLNMLEFVRDVERNGPLVRQGVRRLVNNVNPGAMTPDPDTGDDQVNAILKKHWSTWSQDPLKCHTEGKLSFHGMTNLAFVRTVIDGDMFGLMVGDSEDQYFGSIQTHEAHRCRTPNRSRKDRGICGVQKNKASRTQKFWLTNEPRDANEQVKVSEVTPVNAFDDEGHYQVLHCFNPERFSQSRGITHLAPCIDTEGKRDDLEFSTLVKAQVASCVSYHEEIDPVAYKQWPELFEDITEGAINGTGDDEYNSYSSGGKQVRMSPGQKLGGKPGRKLVGFSPNIPNESYFPFQRMLLTYLAINLDLPLIVLLLDASDSNFSSYRNVMDQARMSWREIHRWMADCWHRPIWSWRARLLADESNPLKIDAADHAVLVAFVADNGLEALCNHKWNAKGYDYIEPVKDATADKIQLAEGLTSLRRFSVRRHGVDWPVLMKEIVDDRALAIRYAHEAAQTLNAELKLVGPGIEITWRDLIPMPTAEGVSIMIGNDEPSKPQPGTEKANAA